MNDGRLAEPRVELTVEDLTLAARLNNGLIAIDVEDS